MSQKSSAPQLPQSVPKAPKPDYGHNQPFAKQNPRIGCTKFKFVKLQIWRLSLQISTSYCYREPHDNSLHYSIDTNL